MFNKDMSPNEEKKRGKRKRGNVYCKENFYIARTNTYNKDNNTVAHCFEEQACHY